MEVINTRIKFISSKKPEKICDAIGSLPFKVEVNGNPVFDGKKWFLFFVIPDFVKDFTSINLD